MRAPMILALLAVLATSSDSTSTLVQADTSPASLATSASQPDKTRSLRSADTATAQLAEERGKPAGLEKAARGLVSRRQTSVLLKPQAASFKKSGKSIVKGVHVPQTLKWFTYRKTRLSDNHKLTGKSNVKERTQQLLEEKKYPDQVIDHLPQSKGLAREELDDVVTSIDQHNKPT